MERIGIKKSEIVLFKNWMDHHLWYEKNGKMYQDWVDEKTGKVTTKTSTLKQVYDMFKKSKDKKKFKEYNLREIVREEIKHILTEENGLRRAQDLADYLRNNLKTPVSNVKISTLGGEDRASVLVTISLDQKKDWINGILHNSRYAMFHLSYDGVLELHSKHHSLPKMRKTKFKNPKDALNKINKYLLQANKESEKLNEAKDQVYFKTFSAAVSYAKEKAEKKYDIDEDDWFNQLSVGGKPGEGKTKKAIILK